MSWVVAPQWHHWPSPPSAHEVVDSEDGHQHESPLRRAEAEEDQLHAWGHLSRKGLLLPAGLNGRLTESGQPGFEPLTGPGRLVELVYPLPEGVVTQLLGEILKADLCHGLSSVPSLIHGFHSLPQGRWY